LEPFVYAGRRGTRRWTASCTFRTFRADEHTRHPTPDGLIPLICNEIQRLSTALVVRPMCDAAHLLHWSA
jgi:hypothetical protein